MLLARSPASRPPPPRCTKPSSPPLNFRRNHLNYLLLLYIVSRQKLEQMGVFGLILGLLTLPPYAIYQTVLYLTSTPPTPAWSLPKHVFSSCMRYLSSCSGASANSHPKPLTDSGTRGPYPAGAFQQPKVARWTVGRGVHVAEVRVAPVGDEWKVGVARVGGHVVKSVEVPGFWVDAVQNAGAPDRLVGADERVVLYFAGGGIRVRPLIKVLCLFVLIVGPTAAATQPHPVRSLSCCEDAYICCVVPGCKEHGIGVSSAAARCARRVAARHPGVGGKAGERMRDGRECGCVCRTGAGAIFG